MIDPLKTLEGSQPQCGNVAKFFVPKGTKNLNPLRPDSARLCGPAPNGAGEWYCKDCAVKWGFIW